MLIKTLILVYNNTYFRLEYTYKFCRCLTHKEGNIKYRTSSCEPI